MGCFMTTKKENMKQMKRIVTTLVVVMGLIMMGNTSKAQGKTGFISLQELIPQMPEYRKADTALNDYQQALAQNFEDMKKGILRSRQFAGIQGYG